MDGPTQSGSIQEELSILEDVFFVKYACEEDHNARKRDLANKLQPLLGDSTDSTLLLCFGVPDKCHIVPVSIPDPTDEVAIWRQLRQTKASYQGWWRRIFNFGIISHISIVKVCHEVMNFSHSWPDKSPQIYIGGVAKGTNNPRSAVKFIGKYTKEDLQLDIDRAERIIQNYEAQEWPCGYNSLTGRTECFQDCISQMIDVDCPERRKFEAERQLQNLKTLSLMSLAFEDPDLASLNDFLQDKSVIYGHRSVHEIDLISVSFLIFCDFAIKGYT
ncbi:hypothetical protein N7468_004541 [Penicillium chermesinum]|uniref:Uncharacterized protein n=1 Tax=Penicillium chermesinum TaxID=63820 RepID=A0A9W9PBM5_9EURO|nr:uncharacterized protein N7468_004541 [Penicillium chermesinum]KAJ5239922.1 hypothetical protein N7468_004541 [Penicillium chermesinum]